MKKRTKGLLLITVFFALGFLLVHFFFTNSDALLLDNEFLITFVGVVSDLFFSLSNILRLVLYENSTKQ